MEDRREYLRKWRSCNKERKNEYTKKYISERVRRYFEHLEGKSCERCGFSDSRALEYHHRDPAQKRWTIAYGYRRFSWEEVELEIEKCELLCANCHAIEHSSKLHPLNTSANITTIST